MSAIFYSWRIPLALVPVPLDISLFRLSDLIHVGARIVLKLHVSENIYNTIQLVQNLVVDWLKILGKKEFTL